MKLRAKVSGHDVKLSWDPDPHALGYDIYRGDQPNPSKKRDTVLSDKTMYFDVAAPGVHHYRVRVIGQKDYSNDVRVVVLTL